LFRPRSGQRLDWHLPCGFVFSYRDYTECRAKLKNCADSKYTITWSSRKQVADFKSPKAAEFIPQAATRHFSRMSHVTPRFRVTIWDFMRHRTGINIASHVYLQLPNSLAQAPVRPYPGVEPDISGHGQTFGEQLMACLATDNSQLATCSSFIILHSYFGLPHTPPPFCGAFWGNLGHRQSACPNNPPVETGHFQTFPDICKAW
jgi:hypothetical protein